MGTEAYNEVRINDVPRNKFDLTHDVKLTCNLGELIPILIMETVPTDKITLGGDALVRIAPLLAPVMDRMDITLHYFYTPYRILWEGWDDFISRDEGTVPFIEVNSSWSTEQQDIAQYFGIPKIGDAWSDGEVTYINAFPFAAYQAIYNEYYRDQFTISEETAWKLSDGANSRTDLIKMYKRAYERDYFTSGLPEAQFGDGIAIPLGEVVLDPNWDDAINRPRFEDDTGTETYGAVNMDSSGFIRNGGALPPNQAYNPDGSLVIDQTNVTELRLALRLQEFLELSARAGTRYYEWLRSNFGIDSSDERLQRPEYIIGVQSPVVISEVLNMSGTFTANDPDEATSNAVGEMAGHGVGVLDGDFGEVYCEDYGLIMGILSIRPKASYSQGIPKHYLKLDRLDYYNPAFAHIGEQAIENQELFAYTNTSTDTFAYAPRYIEYKNIPNRLAGDFYTGGSLEYWHLGRSFLNAPTLSQEFLEIDHADFAGRIFAVDTDDDDFYIQVVNKIIAIRPMPIFGNPYI